MKKYKVTIIPYLNTELKFKSENEAELYPLYFRVTYMRQTTLIRSINEKRYSQLNLSEIGILEEIKELDNLIFFLSECNTLQFNLNGLKEKYLLSQHPLIQAFDTLFRSQVRKNKDKINDPIIVTLNIGEFAPNYPLDLLLTAVNQFFPKYTQKLFGNCIYYVDMIAEWMSYYPIIGDNQPRIIEFLAIANGNSTDQGFLVFLKEKFEDKKKAQKFYLNLVEVISKYLLRDF